MKPSKIANRVAAAAAALLTGMGPSFAEDMEPPSFNHLIASVDKPGLAENKILTNNGSPVSVEGCFLKAEVGERSTRFHTSDKFGQGQDLCTCYTVAAKMTDDAIVTGNGFARIKPSDKLLAAYMSAGLAGPETKKIEVVQPRNCNSPEGGQNSSNSSDSCSGCNGGGSVPDRTPRETPSHRP